MNKIDELKELRNQVINSRNKLKELNQKYNEYLDKRVYKKSKEELVREFLNSKDIDYQDALNNPVIMRLANICVDEDETIKKLEEEEKLNKELSKNPDVIKINSKYSKYKKALIIFEIVLFAIYINLVIFNLPQVIINNFYIGLLGTIIYGDIKINIEKNKEIKKIKQAQKTNTNTEDLNKTITGDELYEEVSKAREYFHKLEKEYENKLNNLSMDDKTTYQNYLRNNFEENLFNFEKDDTDTLKVKKII